MLVTVSIPHDLVGRLAGRSGRKPVQVAALVHYAHHMLKVSAA